MKPKHAACITALTLYACAAQAGLVYTSEAAFIADAGSATAALPATLTATNSFATGPLTFRSDPGQTFVIDTAQYGRPIAGDGNLELNGYESHEVASSITLYAFGFKIFQPSNARPSNGVNGVACYFSCDQGSYTVSLFDGSTLVDRFTFTPVFDTVEFHGYAGATGFNRIRIEDDLRTVDDEYFSTYRYGTTSVGSPQLPEPGSLALVMAALGLGGAVTWPGRKGPRRG